MAQRVLILCTGNSALTVRSFWEGENQIPAPTCKNSLNFACFSETAWSRTPHGAKFYVVSRAASCSTHTKALFSGQNRGFFNSRFGLENERTESSFIGREGILNLILK